jgi:hypothetical protein
MSKQVKQPFCKVCKDAGKPESEYTSHYVRSFPDRFGKSEITCPTLLCTECRYCSELGHTTKFCPVLANNKKGEERAYRQAEHKLATNIAPQQTITSKTAFDVFAYDSDDEKKPAIKKAAIVAKQAIVKQAITKQAVVKKQAEIIKEEPIYKPNPNSWASIAAKTAAQYENEKYEKKLIAASAVKYAIKPKPKKNWADYSDSEDDDEDEED